MPPLVNEVQQFGGLSPKIAPHLLPNGGAQIANNARLYSGALRAWNFPTNISVGLRSGSIMSIFCYEEEYWLNWITDVDVVRSPIGGDMYKRIYWTGDVIPRMSVLGLVNQTAPYPTAYYQLGIPAPLLAPTVAMQGTAGQTQYREERAYCYTYVSNYGEEGPPSPVSALVNYYSDQNNPISVTGMSSAPTGNYYVTTINVYRTLTGSTSTQYQFVESIPVAQGPAGFTDTVLDSALGLVLPSSTWDPPPSDLIGLIALPCGALAGFHTNEVCFSEVYLPHAWPVEYRISFDRNIVALGNWGTSILVMTDGYPFLVTGSAPGQFVYEKLEVGHACVSKRGVVDMGYGILYPSPDGLILAGTITLENVTKNIMTRDDWQKFNPSSIQAAYYNGLYFGFYDATSIGGIKGGFVFDPGITNAAYTISSNPTFSMLDAYATACWRDVVTDSMYICVPNGANSMLQQWDATTTPISYTWKSKPFYNPHPMNLGVAQILADDYSNVNIQVFADGVSKYSGAVTSDDAFRLPSGFRAHRYEFELTGTSNVNKAFLGDVMSSLAQV